MDGRASDVCENCGVPIGRLEKAAVFEDHLVCSACDRRLRADAPDRARRASAISLVMCDECGGNVSTAAASCPHCGNPMTLNYATRTSAGRPRTQTVEQTGKVWKLQQLVSSLICIGGFIMIVVAVSDRDNPDVPRLALGLLALLSGFAWFVFAKVGAWWFHG